MRWYHFCCAIALGGASLLSLAALAATPAVSPNSSPGDLVQAALVAEVKGDANARKNLLAQALAIDPNFAPARWQSGYVQWKGEWLSLDDVAQRAAVDPDLAGYRKLRDAMVDRADDHRALARWCHKNKQVDLERVHWAKVLEFDANDAEALAGLGLQLFAGRLMTREQIEQARQQATEQKQATQSWRPKLAKLRTAVLNGKPTERQAAIKELEAISDPAAIEALELVFATEGESKRSVASNRILLETVSRIAGPEATVALLRRAVLADAQEVRTMAADELKKRPMHAYVPLLIAALPGKIKTQFHVSILPSGTVIYQHEMLLEGRDADVSINYESVMAPGDVTAAILRSQDWAASQLRNAVTWESRAGATKAMLDWQRSRIQYVLERTTGFANSDDPQLWERQYNAKYGWSKPQTTKPYFYETGSYYLGVATPHRDRVVTNDNPPPPQPRPQGFVPQIQFPSGSCFAAGTPIMTADGLKAVEDIKIGDRVYSQQVETGELRLAAVQTTTLRANIPLRKISTASETILATDGHPFWVVGEGWRVAKDLRAGSRLHGLDGPVEITAIEKAKSAEVYNLIVGGAQTYFAGSSRLLVHDNSPLIEDSVGLPGMESTKR